MKTQVLILLSCLIAASASASECSLLQGTTSPILLTLNDAIKTGSTGTLENYILEVGVEKFNVIMENGDTPLTYSAKHSLEVTKYLVEKSVPINALNALGENSLSSAINCGQQSVISYLLSMGASPQGTRAGSLLFKAVNDGNLYLVQNLLEAGAIVDVKDASGRTPLVLAVLKDDFLITHSLLNSKANPNATYRGKNLLREAKSYPVLSALAKNGAVDHLSDDFFYEKKFTFFFDGKSVAKSGKEILTIVPDIEWMHLLKSQVIKTSKKEYFEIAAYRLYTHSHESNTLAVEALLQHSTAPLSGLQLLMDFSSKLIWTSDSRTLESFEALVGTLARYKLLKADDLFSPSEHCRSKVNGDKDLPVICLLDVSRDASVHVMRIFVERLNPDFVAIEKQVGPLVDYAIRQRSGRAATEFIRNRLSSSNNYLLRSEIYDIENKIEGFNIVEILNLNEARLISAEGETPLSLAYKYKRKDFIRAMENFYFRLDVEFENAALKRHGSSLMAVLMDSLISYPKHDLEIFTYDDKIIKLKIFAQRARQSCDVATLKKLENDLSVFITDYKKRLRGASRYEKNELKTVKSSVTKFAHELIGLCRSELRADE